MMYEYECQSCGTEYEAFRPVKDHANGPICCGAISKQVIRTAPIGFVDREIHYRCPVTGSGVTSRRQRNEIMKRNNLMDANDVCNPKQVAKTQKRADKIAKQAAEIPKDLRQQVNKWAERQLPL